MNATRYEVLLPFSHWEKGLGDEGFPNDYVKIKDKTLNKASRPFAVNLGQLDTLD